MRRRLAPVLVVNATRDTATERYTACCVRTRAIDTSAPKGIPTRVHFYSYVRTELCDANLRRLRN